MRYLVCVLLLGAAGLASGCGGGERVGDESAPASYYSDDEDDGDTLDEGEDSGDDADEDAPQD